MIFNIIYLTIRTFVIKFCKLQNGITSIEYAILIACITTTLVIIFLNDRGSFVVFFEGIYRNLGSRLIGSI